MVLLVTPVTNTVVRLEVGEESEKNAKSDALAMSKLVFECLGNLTTGCPGDSSQNYGLVTASDASRLDWVFGQLLLQLDSNTTVYLQWIDTY